MANSQTFTLNIKAVADMKDVQTNIQNIQNALGKLKLPDSLKTSFKTTFSNLEKEVIKYQNLLANGIKTKTDANTLEKSIASNEPYKSSTLMIAISLPSRLE